MSTETVIESEATLLRIVCGWCAAPMGTKPGDARTAGAVSHSICPGCRARFFGKPATGQIQLEEAA